MNQEIIFKLGVIIGRLENTVDAWRSYCDEYGVRFSNEDASPEVQT